MRTVKQVSDLTGISIRTLHYYDEIGLLKPSEVTEAGYRLYDDEALEILQQILFFKELDMPLKAVKEIMLDSSFDKIKVLKEQEKLLILKRDRLNRLIELINKTIRGEGTMSFNEFDMSEYFNTLESLKNDHKDIIIEAYGSVEKFDKIIEKAKLRKDDIAKDAIKEYGSINKFAKAVKSNFLNSELLSLSRKFEEFKSDILNDKHPKLKELYSKLTSDLSKEISSEEIQKIAKEITEVAKKDYEVFSMETGDDNWYSIVQIYLIYPDWIKLVDKKYGEGASKFIGEALKYSLKDNEPKINQLYKQLTLDLNKDVSSEEVQKVVREIVDIINRSNELYKIDVGENYFAYQADQYMNNETFIKVNDKKYGEGASKFIGEALKYYAENNK